ncbi:nuclease-related domain-containing protein [Neobacillus sp. NRS-1170]|uniref:nuclease-related domain-containing protein n=1 Tax=Neobacillus sp. NRS-1170 TaxID=3233898 RepID=UPI003D2BFDA5
MAFKPRIEPLELRILRILNTRMELTEEERRNYFNLEKGYQGEVQFDLLTEILQSNCYILNDLLLESNNKDFQIDSSLIFQEPLYIFEVKNYQGDFIFKPDRLETLSGKIYPNPLDQLKRTKTLLRQLLQNLGYNIPIEGYVVFNNPEFFLYQAPLNEPIIYAPQLNTFMKKLNMKQSKLGIHHKKLAEKLVSLHKIVSPYSKLWAYSFEEQRKGMTCSACHSFNVYLSAGKLVCDDCGCEEEIDAAVLRSVEEIKLLFPEMKITTNVVREWCVVISMKKIRRVLKQNYSSTGRKEYSFF